MKKYAAYFLILLFMFFSFSNLLFAENGGRDIGSMIQRADRNRSNLSSFIRELVSSMIFGLIGILLAIIGYKLFDIVTPFSLAKELAEDQNIAVGIVVGAIIIGISIIVSKAII